MEEKANDQTTASNQPTSDASAVPDVDKREMYKKAKRIISQDRRQRDAGRRHINTNYEDPQFASIKVKAYQEGFTGRFALPQFQRKVMLDYIGWKPKEKE